MAMTTCQFCEQSVSEHAPTCPACGKSNPVATEPVQRYITCLECKGDVGIEDNPYLCNSCGCTLIRLDGVYRNSKFAFRAFDDGRIFMAKCGYTSFSAAEVLGNSKLLTAEPWSHQIGTFYLKPGPVIIAQLDGEQDGFKLEFTINGKFVENRLECSVSRRMQANVLKTSDGDTNWEDWFDLPKDKFGTFTFEECEFSD